MGGSGDLGPEGPLYLLLEEQYTHCPDWNNPRADYTYLTVFLFMKRSLIVQQEVTGVCGDLQRLWRPPILR